MRKIGIIGQGFVGTALKVGMKKYYTIETYDLDETKRTCGSLDELVDKANYIFICLPTPMRKDGSCDTSIVEGVVKDINEAVVHRNCSNRTIIIKSTVPPGTTNKLNNECENIDVMFNPEFLTEANYIDDFKNQTRIILGGERKVNGRVKNLYSKVFSDIKIVKTSPTIAEMVKYTTNTFLSTKVSFANEIEMICDKLDIDYDKVVEYATYDERLGLSHWNVPGPDGKRGFGGSCFPKDINALLEVANKLGVEAFTLDGVWETNLQVRPEKDWEELKGRAVVEE